MDNNICVATMAGFWAWRQARMMRFWMMGSSCRGHSMPRSPRATMTTSVRARMSSMLSTEFWRSILATTGTQTPCLAISSRRLRMSAAFCTKEMATALSPISRPSCRSLMSLSVRAGRGWCFPGKAIPLREDRSPAFWATIS